MVDVLLIDEESHSLLALVGDDFLAGEGLVADGEFCHVDESATLFHKFGETVDVACRTVVVDADNWVDIFLAEGADEVVGTFLHLWVGALHCVEFDA